MWVTILTLGVSVVLLLYWFRYTCLLLLSTRPARDYAGAVAQTNSLHFIKVQEKLEGTHESGHLDALQKALDRDYKLITCLIRHGAEFQMAGRQMERALLMTDYHVMRAVYSMSRRVSRRRKALAEMVTILEHFADMMGECASHAGALQP